MARIVTLTTVYDAVSPDSEKVFEEAVIANSESIFGKRRYYIDCKHRIGVAGKKVNVPDAYLIDLQRNQPRLFVVENELSTHDLFKHIGKQLLEFSYSYQQAKRQVRSILLDEVSKVPKAIRACREYAQQHGYRGLDHLLDYLVFETPFQAVVIIDERTEELDSVVKQFSFPIEVIEFVMFRSDKGEHAYSFTPFLEEVAKSVGSDAQTTTDIAELDTIVVPAREAGFQETFLGENRWYAIRMNSSMIPQIKDIAVYRKAPTSAITHVAPVSMIVPWQDTGKYCVEFAQPAREIVPIRLKTQAAAPQAPRYTSLEKLQAAKTLDEVFPSLAQSRSLRQLARHHAEIA